MATIKEHRAWKRANPGWPLTVHPCGQWVKTVCGKETYLGSLDDRDGALRKWNAIRTCRGVRPKLPAAPKKEKKEKKKYERKVRNAFTVARLFERHRADLNSRVKAGRLAKATINDYVRLPGIAASAGVDKLGADDMNPTEFAKIMHVIESSGKGLRTQKNLITSMKTVFNWGADMEFCRRVNFGPRMKAPSMLSIEKEREDRGVVRFIERETILAALDICRPEMKIAILLGVNCAFYPSDTIKIGRGNFHTEGPIAYHDFRRVKTLQKRKAVLWPETIYAVERWWHLFKPAKFTRRTPALLASGFVQVLKKLGIDPGPGVGIGSLRHTYASVVDSVPDQAMIDLTMGHTSRVLQKRVYATVNLDELERLQVLSDKVHDWLYND